MQSNSSANLGANSNATSSVGQWFEIAAVEEKIAKLPEALGQALALTQPVSPRGVPARDVQVLPASRLPKKPGIASRPGQARLLHDLASIELQAMELGMRTLAEFPDAPREFREQLAEVTIGEGRHLGLCLRALESMNARWGDWPVHVSLWNATGVSDTLLDRVLIVHRYLEGSGLDAGDSILRRLHGVTQPGRGLIGDVTRVIVEEEIGHVLFGSIWYRRIAESLKIDPERDFSERMISIAKLVPRREVIAHDLRLKAGFTPAEIATLEACRLEGLRTPHSVQENAISLRADCPT